VDDRQLFANVQCQVNFLIAWPNCQQIGLHNLSEFKKANPFYQKCPQLLQPQP